MDAPPLASRGSELEILVRLRSDGVGHDLPSGYAFWRELWLEMRVEDAAGRLLFVSGELDEDAHLPDEFNPLVRENPERYDPYLWSLRARLVKSPAIKTAWMGEDRRVNVPEEAIRRNRTAARDGPAVHAPPIALDDLPAGRTRRGPAARPHLRDRVPADPPSDRRRLICKEKSKLSRARSRPSSSSDTARPYRRSGQ